MDVLAVHVMCSGSPQPGRMQRASAYKLAPLISCSAIDRLRPGRCEPAFRLIDVSRGRTPAGTHVSRWLTVLTVDLRGQVQDFPARLSHDRPPCPPGPHCGTHNAWPSP